MSLHAVEGVYDRICKSLTLPGNQGQTSVSTEGPVPDSFSKYWGAETRMKPPGV